MSKVFKAVKISDRVHWVGAIDWGIRDFHGYSTERGSTYNAYLVMADKITLIDTVKAPFREELLSRISSVVDPASISYIVSNHAEMDHSGCLREVVEAVRPEKVFASAMGVKALKDHFHLDLEIEGVKEGESLSLGDRQLTFTETRMIHWPDSMFSYLSDDDVLFSQDGFGMHLAASERFADEIPDDVLEFEGARYFANILLPFAPRVEKLLEKVAALGITPKIIAPDHGPIWRRDLGKILECYSRWSAQKPGRKAVIVYDTMWGSTHRMARAIAEGVTAGGSAVKIMPLKSCHRSDVAGELLDAGALIVGSPTLNNNIFPTVADVMTYLKGLKPANKIGAVFGSYGWSGEATTHLKKILEGMGVDMAGEVMKVKYVPGDEVLESCFNLGRKIAGRLAKERE
jgi:flavorubredoxin